MLRLLITIVGLVVDRGRGMISLGMVDSVVNGMVGSWATSGKRDFHVGNKYKFFLTSVVPQIEPSLAANTSFCCFDKTGILTSDDLVAKGVTSKNGVVVCPVSEATLVKDLTVFWKYQRPPGYDSVCALFCMVEKIFS